MDVPNRRALVGLIGCCLVVVALPGGVAAGSLPSGSGDARAGDRAAVAAPSSEGTLVVDADAEAGEYATVQAAVGNASAGDRIEVRPGVYRERVDLRKNVTVVAPDGATLNGSGFSRFAAAFSVNGDAAPTAAGFTVTGYEYAAVDALGEAGNWTVRNLTVRDQRGDAVDARFATGDWRVANLTVRNIDTYAVYAIETEGSWRVEGLDVRSIPDGAVAADDATGDWTVRNLTVADARVGIDAPRTTGDWTVLNASVAGGKRGVLATDATGAWRVRNLSVTALRTEAVRARNTSGAWVVTGSNLSGTAAAAVDAREAAVRGDATGNWWGDPSGAAPDDCVGNVDCTDPLSSPPNADLPSGPPPVVGDARPGDPDGDGLYEDVNGDGDATPGDATVLFDAIFDGDAAVTGNVGAFDFSGDGRLVPGDATVLFGEVFG